VRPAAPRIASRRVPGSHRCFGARKKVKAGHVASRTTHPVPARSIRRFTTPPPSFCLAVNPLFSGGDPCLQRPHPPAPTPSFTLLGPVRALSSLPPGGPKGATFANFRLRSSLRSCSSPSCCEAPYCCSGRARNKLNSAPQRFSVVFAVEMLLRPAGGTACRRPASGCRLGSHRDCRKPSPSARCCRRKRALSARRSACCRPRSSTPRH